MGKGGGGGGGGGSTNIKQLPLLFNQNAAGTPSIMQGLTDLTTGERSYLNQPGGLSSLYATGINQVAGFGDAGLIGSPYQTEGLGLASEMGLAPQYQNLYNQAQGMTGYGQGQLEGMYGQIPGLEQGVSSAQGGVGNYQNQVSDYQRRVALAEQGVTDLEQGTGLYPSQQAYVDQAVRSGQAAVQQQLASEGLTSSTQNAMLQNQVAQSGAATAGQLMQGNIQLAQAGVGQAQQDVGLAQTNVGLQQQNVAQAQAQQQLVQQGIQLAQQLTIGEQGLSGGNLQALNAMWSNVAQQAGGANASAFQNAVNGVGVLGGFFNQIGQTYDVQLKGLQLQLEQEVAQAKINADLQKAEIDSASQGKSTMMGGLGSILGKGGGGGGAAGGGGKGGGGIFGGISSLFGGGAAAAGTVGAAAGTTSIAAEFGTAAALGLAGV